MSSEIVQDEQLICEFCGLPITADRDECPALHEGVCQP